MVTFLFDPYFKMLIFGLCFVLYFLNTVKTPKIFSGFPDEIPGLWKTFFRKSEGLNLEMSFQMAQILFFETPLFIQNH
jgi:hypothetical protein